jgi:regulation of enolase protein 1 (concanavalin A-like superfamily)
VTDPDGDCKVKAQGDRLTMTVPASHHNLHPGWGMNAPRVLQDVEGDFTVEVKVTGDFKPTDESSWEGSRPFIGAGLLIWQDAKNLLRVERNAIRAPEQNLTFCYPPLIEYYWDGEYQDTNPEAARDAFFKDRSTYLRLQRRGDTVKVSLSHDGKKWIVAKQVRVRFAKKVKVGVAAISTSNKPFAVEFTELRIATAK